VQVAPSQAFAAAEMMPERFYHRQTIDWTTELRMTELLAQISEATLDGTITAAAFRDRVGTGRKLAIIILEFFDRTGVAIRRGDLCKVQRNRLRTFAGPAREPI
jgi:selenocysteine-specific elongation SelB-like protein